MSTAIAPLPEPTDIVQVVAANVRAYAARLGYSQVALGRALGMAQGAVHARWRGTRPWHLAELGDVALVLGVSVQDLVTDPAEMQNPRRWIAPTGAAARPKGLEPPTFWLGADAPVATVTDLQEWHDRRAS